MKNVAGGGAGGKTTAMKGETESVRRQLDLLLKQIRARQAAIAALQKEMTAKIEAVAAQYRPGILAAEEELKTAETELIGLARFNKAALFAGTDRVDVKSGAVLRTLQERVVKIKAMLAKLKAAGMRNYIRTVESPDWDGIEKLSNAELAKLGTRREKKEIFAYEVKEV